MFNYCTLFDQKYMSRGLALYDSLISVNASFHLYILAMDEGAYFELKKLNLPHATVISLSEFEDADLLAIKSTRTRQEYCWTCTPSIIKYCIDHYRIPECTYLDADILFFSDPRILHDELADNSILITKHNFYPQYDQSKTSGKYCVQFITFRNDEYGRGTLEWWRNACNEWCFARHENGKFGDQKYLDDWTERFERVHVLENHGGGLAPWNLPSYQVFVENDRLKIQHKRSGKKYQVVFYHFHDFYIDEAGSWYHGSGIGGYKISKEAYRYIYARYLQILFRLRQQLPSTVHSDFPELPDLLSKREFLHILLPALIESADLNLLSSAYLPEGEFFRLNIFPNDREKLFAILLRAGYKLNQDVQWEHELLSSRDSETSRFILKFRQKLKASLKRFFSSLYGADHTAEITRKNGDRK